MSTIKFTPESMPQSGEALKKILRQALEQTVPLDDFVQVIRDLTQYELRHGMSSSAFFARFEAGEMGDEIDLMRWANKYEVYRETKADSVIASQPPDLSEILREIDGILYEV